MPKNIRPIYVDGNIAFVPLTQGLFATIDVQDVPLVSGKNWYAWNSCGFTYAVRCEKRSTVRMHRVLMGNVDGLHVDHIDMNGLNNRRSNLREATRSENKCNMRARADNSSGIKGAQKAGYPGKWKSTITVRGVRTYLGVFSTPEQAHAAYCDAVEKYHKEFARTK